MDYKKIIGQKVTNRSGECGVVKSLDGEYFEVDFGGRIARVTIQTMFKGWIKVSDPTLQEEIFLEKIEVEKRERQKKKEKENNIAISNVIKEEKSNSSIASSHKKTTSVKLDDLFGNDYHVEHLKRTPILTYQEVERRFRITITGFGRGINVTDDAIILISSMDKKNGKFVYHDHWTEDGDYIFSGEGKSGDQVLTRGNKAIIDSVNDETPIYLFVKLSSKEYYFQGEFCLINYTYDLERDEAGNLRKEYKFRLRKVADPED